MRLLFKTAREEHEGVKSRMHAEAFRLNALIAANKDAWCATAKALVAAPARVSAPEKPDPATGRALFEPESAAAAKAAHRRTEPAPKAAGTASCAIPLPPAGRTPTRAAPEKSTGILSPAQKELSQQRPPHVGTQMSAEAFVAMQKSMEASVRRFVDQMTGFDKGAFWKAARQDAPLSAAAIVKTESLMGVPGGTFSITPHEPDMPMPPARMIPFIGVP